MKQKLNGICALELGDCGNYFHPFGLFVELYSYILCLCYSYLRQLIIYFVTVCLIEQENVRSRSCLLIVVHSLQIIY